MIHFMSDFITAILHKRAVEFDIHQLSCYYDKRMTNLTSQVACHTVLPTFVYKNTIIWHKWNALYFSWLEHIIFLMSNRMSNNLKPHRLDVLIIQIDFCLIRLYVSLLIETQIVCINKSLLVDDNVLNKAIWKLVLS